MKEKDSNNERIKIKYGSTLQKRVSKILPNVIIKGQYISAKTNIEAYCSVHDYTWFPRPCNLLSGFGCPLCGKEKRAKKRKKPIGDILKLLKEKHPSAEIISDISNITDTKSNVIMKCKICEYTWSASISNLTKNNNPTGCPECAKVRVANSCRKSLDDLKEQASLINTTVEPIANYTNNHTPVLCRCTLHIDTLFYQIPTTILKGSNSCPKCTTFKHEKIMLDVLDKYNLTYTPQKTFDGCIDIRKLPFDAFLEDYNIAIEYDGEGHYYPIPRYKGDDGSCSFERAKLHDEIKNQYCEKNKINLIRIPYWEQNNIENFLVSELLKYNVKIA